FRNQYEWDRGGTTRPLTRPVSHRLGQPFVRPQYWFCLKRQSYRAKSVRPLRCGRTLRPGDAKTQGATDEFINFIIKSCRPPASVHLEKIQNGAACGPKRWSAVT